MNMTLFVFCALRGALPRNFQLQAFLFHRNFLFIFTSGLWRQDMVMGK